MKIAIVGSRNLPWPEVEKIRDFVKKLPHGTIVISGGAEGVDTYALGFAKDAGLITVVVRPAWKTAEGRVNKGAGFHRNSVIVDLADEVYAFWDGDSHGTADTMAKARTAGKLKWPV